VTEPAYRHAEAAAGRWARLTLAEQLANVGSSWDGRLRRIARIAEEIERQKQKKQSPQQRARSAK